MALRISPTHSSLPPPPLFSAVAQNGESYGQPLAEGERVKLERLLCPDQGYRYLYQIKTPHVTKTILDFPFDLKLFFKEVEDQLAAQGLSIHSICVAKEAARSILFPQGGVFSRLDVDIHLEGRGEQKAVSEALLAALKTITYQASGTQPAEAFFKDNGFLRSDAAGEAAVFPLQWQGGERQLHVKILTGATNPCASSADCFQIESASLLIGRGGGPPALRASDGYDPERARDLTRSGQFEVLPEKAAQVEDGAFEYIRLVTGKKRPLSLMAEAALWAGFSKDPASSLMRYLGEYYKNNDRGAIFFLLNLEDFAARASGSEKKQEVRTAIAQAAARRLHVPAPSNAELFLACGKTHLFLKHQSESAGVKFYFDGSGDPIYHVFPEEESSALFMHCPLEPLAAVLAHEEECSDARGAFEKLFPLQAECYPRLVKACLAGLSKSDYPSCAVRELLSALFSKETSDVPRFFKGLLRQAKKAAGPEERSRLVNEGLALFHHVHNGAPLTLERLKKGSDCYEEAMIEDLASTPYWDVALQISKQFLGRQAVPSAVVKLLQNPAVLQDPLARAHYRMLRSLEKEAELPATCFSLFLLYYDPKAKGEAPLEEGAYLERVLTLRGRMTLNAEEQQRLSSVALDLVPRVMEADLHFAQHLVEILTKDPSPVENEVCETLLVQCIPQFLLAKDPNDFERAKTFFITNIKERRVTPAAAAKGLKETLSSLSAKEPARFGEMVELIGDLEPEYFKAQNGNSSLCMERAVTSFKRSLGQVVKIAHGASALERAAWVHKVLKLGTQEAFAACSQALESKETFRFLEEDISFWLGYISLGLAWDQARAVALFLEKEPQLQKFEDFEKYLDLCLAPNIPAQEERFADLFARMEKEGTPPKKKMAAVQCFAQQVFVGGSPPLARQALEVLSVLPIQILKTEAGIATLFSVAEGLPRDPKAYDKLLEILGNIRQSAGGFEGASFAFLVKKAIEFLVAAPAGPQALEEILSILQFALTQRNFPEELFYPQLTRALAVDEKCWNENTLKAAHSIVSTAASYFKSSAEDHFLSIVRALFAVVKKQLERPSSKESLQRAAALWEEFLAALLKKCSRAGPRTVSVLVQHQIAAQCSFAKKLYEIDPSHPIADEIKQARKRLLEAAEKPLFCSVAHMRESFASLAELMTMHPESQMQILPMMKPYNFQGRDYLELLARLERFYTDSGDERTLTEVVQVGFHLFNFSDLAKSLTDEEIRQTVHKYIALCSAELKKPIQEQRTFTERIVVRILQILVLASKNTSEVLRYIKEHEEEFLQLLEETFARVVTAENPRMLSALTSCLHYMLLNNWAQGIALLI